MDFFLENKQVLAQKLSLTPEIKQSLAILQMNSIDLLKHIEDISMENPILEYEENVDYIYDNEKENNTESKIEWLKKSDEENKYLYKSNYEDNTEQRFNQIADENICLKDYLLNQVNTMKMSAKEHKVYVYIIESMDHNGYLNMNIEEIAKNLNLDLNIIERTYDNIVYTLDPPGVGAKNLEHCLKLQLARKNLLNDTLEEILNKHLHNIAQNKLHIIAKELKVSISEIIYYCDLIKSLNPKPGSIYNEGKVEYVTPDVLVFRNGTDFYVELNNASTPKIYVNSNYNKNLMNADKKANEYIKKKYEQALWIYKCVSQRNETLLNISNKIVELQRDFFLKGPGNLKPLILADIANELSIHESTVSRGVNDKWLQCSWGTYELKYFFSSGVGEHSSDMIKNKLKNTVKNEDKSKPLSDQKITNILSAEGIKISRRTVAKYREEMNIPNASGRKEYS